MKSHLNALQNKTKGRILIVEDDPSLTEILESLFTDEGYVIKTVPESLDIIPLIDEFSPDLVLLDYLLPTVNGGELCSQLKQDHNLNHISVILYSAYSKVLMSIGDYGCDIFLEKPFDLDVLLKNVDDLLSGRHHAKYR